MFKTVDNPWVRGGCIACSRGQGIFQCGVDAHPSNHAQYKSELCNCPSSRPVCYLGYFLRPRFMGYSCLSFVSVYPSERLL